MRVEEVQLPRKYVFLELFARKAGFSREVARCCASLVDVKEPLDIHENWDILDDAGFEAACKAVGEADRARLAFLCRSFYSCSQNRSARVNAGDSFRGLPSRLGASNSRGGKQDTRTVHCFGKICLEKGKTVSFENPEQSFAWMMPKMIKVINQPEVFEVGLDQCPYGAISVKATKIVTNAAWFKDVARRCQDVRPRYHHPGGLQGKTWDPVTWEIVWLMSKAAEYPWGLCNAWATSLDYSACYDKMCAVASARFLQGIGFPRQLAAHIEQAWCAQRWLQYGDRVHSNTITASAVPQGCPLAPLTLACWMLAGKQAVEASLLNQGYTQEQVGAATVLSYMDDRTCVDTDLQRSIARADCWVHAVFSLGRFG